MKKSVDVIGAGLSGLYAACYLAKNGYQVRVFEKNESVGGRSRVFEAEGFTFDMGPSWYWMPELIDKMFEDLGENRQDYYQLKRLDPAYRIFWKDHEPTDIPADMHSLKKLFDGFEPNGGEKLEAFLSDAKTKYDIAVDKFLFKPGLKWKEIVNLGVFKSALKLDVFKSVDKDVSKRFTSAQAKAILNFPVLFLGEMPSRIPSLYTLMNHADLSLGTWYPEGGMSATAKALKAIAEKHGVEFHLNAPLKSVEVVNDKVQSMLVGNELVSTEKLIVSADYHYVEQNILPPKYRSYNENYWDSRKLAPSSLIFYLGVDKKIDHLQHHNLFFDEDLMAHGETIYKSKSWPTSPLFYVCAPSKTDGDVAPEGKENLFVLIPVAPDLDDNQEIRDRYLQIVINRIKKHTGVDITDHIIYKRDYCVSDFKQDYNAYKGNAYGLANTLKQTANLKPKIKSKLNNLNYCGQLTVPGPGVPPALISGQLAASQIILSK
ncbi:phytoene desaturase family protein [Paracrocinitomix mangrovi]|uniref:phytoene desaturase family protein n=1 Tax=Paracrocinitomix mangrovi TaxID=2862509 RepID=UPI001C8D513B|nr:phytoene desaturase family protein [Paracrocinitomix mangrovi]UKN03617.1 phytoene desaturase family protein [Paracrocinitomix mangrovi]